MERTESSDDDQSLLDQVLNNLYDFGDGVAPGAKLKKKKKKQQQQQQQQGKRRAEEDEVSEGLCGDAEDADTQPATAPVHPQAPRIQTPHVEVVTFEDPTKKTRVQQKPTSGLRNEAKVKDKEEANMDNPEELSFEKARLEVHQFGIRGYRKEKQRSFEQERAIMLGAKPPKRQYVNYKTLQQDLQDKKKKAKEEVQTDQKKSKSKKKNSKPGDKKTKKKNKTTPSVFGSSAGSASMGRFKGGVLTLSSKEIEKINGPDKRR